MSMQRAFQQRPEIAERFPDLHPPFAGQQARVEANRCLNCFDAPCTSACPTHIDVPRFIKKIATDNLPGSAISILDANVLGASCARVCPVAVLCEGACVMHGYNREPIAIGRLQRYAMDAFHASGAKLPSRGATPRQEKIACIGAGPASLACAAELRLRGFQVVVLEKRALPGGLNTHGVAEYKLPSRDSLNEIKLIEDLGVEFRFGTAVSSAVQLDALEAGCDAIFLGIGLGAMKHLGIPGESDAQHVDALTFIERYKTGDAKPAVGRVLVIGAGNTGIDAAIAAVRLGSANVRVLSRRGEGQMAAFRFEYEHARLEGVNFTWMVQPVQILLRSDGPNLLRCVQTEFTSDGAPVTIPGTEFDLPFELLISAIGQSPLLELLSGIRHIELEAGRVRVDRQTGQTANPKYYAGGDCVNGGREVVDAVADGKRAAAAIAQALEAAHG